MVGDQRPSPGTSRGAPWSSREGLRPPRWSARDSLLGTAARPGGDWTAWATSATLTLMVNVDEAKAHFPALLARVAAGEEIVIGEAGRPVAKLIPYAAAQGPRSPGGWQGRVRMAPDFDEASPDIGAFGGDG
ncbi:MAG: type II toxin-antitoxin system Phd/YefM family antitoxin [Actinomycetota bacterium]